MGFTGVGSGGAAAAIEGFAGLRDAALFGELPPTGETAPGCVVVIITPCGPALPFPPEVPAPPIAVVVPPVFPLAFAGA